MSSLDEAIVKLLKSEGFRVNETIRDAIADLIDVVDDENEAMDIADDEAGEEDPEEEDDL